MIKLKYRQFLKWVCKKLVLHTSIINKNDLFYYNKLVELYNIPINTTCGTYSICVKTDNRSIYRSSATTMYYLEFNSKDTSYELIQPKLKDTILVVSIINIVNYRHDLLAEVLVDIYTKGMCNHFDICNKVIK